MEVTKKRFMLNYHNIKYSEDPQTVLISIKDLKEKKYLSRKVMDILVFSPLLTL
jgi:hypothetical protein